jgi:hypothetical protein
LPGTPAEDIFSPRERIITITCPNRTSDAILVPGYTADETLQMFVVRIREKLAGDK